MQKIKYFNFFYHRVLFFCSKRCQIKFSKLFDHENKQQKRIELQNISINHSADIDYQDYKKIYRECTKEPFNFLAINTTLPARNLLRFRKNLFESL